MTHRDLAWALEQKAKRTAQTTPTARGADWRQATVATVAGDGTITTTDGIKARCLTSYTTPATGDLIVISQAGNGQWLALNRLATSNTPLYTPIYRYKTVTLDRTSNTLTDDPDLTIQLDAGAVYKVEYHLHYAATDAARFRTAWTVPPAAAGNRSAIGPDQAQILSATSSGGTGRWGVHNFGTACIYGTRDSNNNQCVALEEALVTTTSAGTCALQWAQQNTNATASRLAAGSFMRVTRIG
ncbi:hypothetical protein ABZV65_19295 [Streptomyces bauhiniae]|uniref:hypothetical protein n=1 Tax=Streptomyces bauhiniae TaxID=2340725 RepID=UPI0033AE944A